MKGCKIVAVDCTTFTDTVQRVLIRTKPSAFFSVRYIPNTLCFSIYTQKVITGSEFCCSGMFLIFVHIACKKNTWLYSVI